MEGAERELVMVYLSMYVLVSSLSLFMVLYLMCFFVFDFSGEYVNELIEE